MLDSDIFLRDICIYWKDTVELLECKLYLCRNIPAGEDLNCPDGMLITLRGTLFEFYTTLNNLIIQGFILTTSIFHYDNSYLNKNSKEKIFYLGFRCFWYTLKYIFAKIRKNVHAAQFPEDSS